MKFRVGAFTRRLIAAMVVLAAILPLPRLCAAAEPVTIEIPIFAGGEGTNFFLYAAREYEKITPNVKINLYGSPRIADQVRLRILEGTYPQITDANIDYWPLIKHGDIQQMDSYLAGPNWEHDAVWRDTFAAGCLDPYMENGKTYGIPLSLFTNVIWYNPAIFDKYGWTAPKTWEEFFDLCEKMRAVGVEPLAFQGRYSYYAEPILASAYYSIAGLDAYKDFRDIRKGAFDNPALIRALGITQKFSSYFQPGALGMSHTEAQTQFLLGKTAMLPCGTWFISEMKDKIPEGFKVRAFNLPQVKNGVGDPTGISAFSNYFFVMSHAPHQKESVDFLRFLTSRRMVSDFTSQRDIPGAIHGAGIKELSGNMADVVRINNDARLNYGNDGGATFDKHPLMELKFKGVMDSLLADHITPEAGAKQLEFDAAAVRNLENNPDRVQLNHPVAASVLLSLVGAAILFLIVRAVMIFRRRRTHRSFEEPPGGRMGWRAMLLFTLPAIVIYSAFVVIPSARAIVWSFYNWDGISDRHLMNWVGFLHFRRLLLESDSFWTALDNNVFLMLMVPLFVVPMALFLAACLRRGIWGSKFFRIVFFFPNLLGTVAATFLWMHLYNPQGGLVNSVLQAILNGFSYLASHLLHALIFVARHLWLARPAHFVAYHLGLERLRGFVHHILNFRIFDGFAWISPDHLYWALIPMFVWALCGFNMVLYLASMQSIPQDLYEAADIEGASQWRQFWTVTLPLIWEMLAISFVFMILAGMKAFDVIWLLTNQQPDDKTNVVGTRLVQVMFSEFNVGQATAMAVILFLLVFVGSATSLQVMKRESVDMS